MTFFDYICKEIELANHSINEVSFVQIGWQEAQMSFDTFSNWAKKQLDAVQIKRSCVVDIHIVFSDNSWLEWVDVSDTDSWAMEYEFQYHKVVPKKINRDCSFYEIDNIMFNRY